MASRHEDEWKKLWCPKAFPVISSSSISGNGSANRRYDGEIPPACLCLGSACAAFWYDTDKPDDGHQYKKYSLSAQNAKIFDPLQTAWAPAGWEYCGMECDNPTDSDYLRRYTVTWRKPWQPIGFCSAFSHPDRFPTSE